MTSISSSTPLVSVQDVTACIALMRCIHKLQEDLQLGERKPPIPDALKSLSHSVMRFGVWLTTRRDSQANLSALDQIPPLDVLMVWHTYMLMPITYWIDSQQSLPILALLGGIPWENLVNIVVQFRGVMMINRIRSAQVHQCRNSRFYSDIRSASYLGGINLPSIYPRYDSGTSWHRFWRSPIQCWPCQCSTLWDSLLCGWSNTTSLDCGSVQ